MTTFYGCCDRVRLDAGAENASSRPFRLEIKSPRSAIPIYVAALKQKAIAGIDELAAGWILTFWPHGKLAEGRSWVATGAARAGRDPAQIAVAPFASS